MLSPDRDLQRGVLVWFVLAVTSVPIPILRPIVSISAILLIAVLLADTWLSRAEAPLEIERRTPEKCARGREVEVVLCVENPLPRAVEIEVRDSVPRDLITEEPHWEAVRIEAGSTRRLCYRIRPRVRGRRGFGTAVALVRSPLGLLRRRALFDREQVLLVHPETERFLRPEALDPRKVLAAFGVRPRRRRGDGTDFDSLRDYVAGDEIRRIDWHATARRGRPIVRTHRHEESRTLLLAVDCSRLMGARAPANLDDPLAHGSESESRAGFASTKLDFAVDAALALAFASLAAGDRVGLVVFDHRVRHSIAPVSERGNLGLFVDALSGIQPNPVEADYRRVTREILARYRKRAMLIVLTDFIEVDEEELIHPMGLLTRHHEVVFVALREPILDDLDAAGALDRKPKLIGQPATARLYQRIVLADLLREREGRLVTLRRHGLSVLDVRPAEATVATLNRFLELRYGAA